MPLLVTGGLGFVGSHFVWAAVEEGRRVVVLDDASAGSPAALPAGVEVVRGDVGDRALLASLLASRRPSAVVHFAGKIQVAESVAAPGHYLDHNLGRSLALLEAVRVAGVPRLVFSSSASVYGEPLSVPIAETAAVLPVHAYGASKLAFEVVLASYARCYGLGWAALRYFNAAGAHPRGHLREAHEPETHLLPLALDAALGRRPPLRVFGADYATADGTCVRDYVHVGDLATAHLRALDVLAAGRPVGAVNLGAGRGHSVREVLEATRAVVGRAVPFVEAPRRPGDPPALVADLGLARALLGFAPQRSELGVLLEDCLRSRR